MRSFEFDGAPLVAGQITGVRSFRVDTLGRLTGVSQRDVWLPGENDAKCSEVARSLASMSHSIERAAAALSGRPSAAKRVPPALTKDAATVHRPGQVGCACGFYAYFDRGANPHHRGSNVVGVIEGHGTVTVGSRGFRAEHASIAALVAPNTARGFLAALDSVAARIKGGSWTVVLVVLGLLVGVFGFSFGVTFVGDVGWYALLFILPVLVGGLTACVAIRAEFMDADSRPDPRDAFKRVCANYPDVPVYRSVRAALRAHPLTPPPPPLLPSPATDADFWTRSTS